MNKKIRLCIIIILAIVAIIMFIGCDSPAKEIVYVPVKDTTEINNCENKIIELEYKLKLTQDSLNAAKDSLGEDLFVAKYKLERIKYYTNIIDNNPSQIKFYKGWIKRVLKD